MNKGKMTFATLVILALAFMSLSLLEYATLGNEKTVTSTVEVTQHATALWEVLKDNVTLYGQTACMAINFGALGGCPTPIPYGNGTLSDVELLSYDGSDYYAVTFPPVTNRGMPGSSQITYTVWFTNSTIFCAEPPVEFPALSYPVCP